MSTASQTQKSARFGLIALVYLVGLVVGGLYVGIVAPLRTVIQADFGISSSLGIWIINIYTLFYAATIPVSGSLADRYGRKPVYLCCLGLFSVGAAICGCSQFADSFALLLAGRVLQACGAGGIIPVASAELGTTAPEDKRGMWLGICAAVSGLANVLGAACGSGLVSLLGSSNWCGAFFVAVPLGVLLMVGAAAWFPAGNPHPQGALDLRGSLALILLVLALLLGLKGIDFSNFAASISASSTWLFLALALILTLVFVWIERRAESPVFHMEYFKSKAIVIIMAISFFVGCSIISMTLIPEFAEFALGASVGSGGYFMSIIGVFAIAGPIVGGKLIDKVGPKPILACGLGVCALGYIFLALVAASHPSTWLLLVGLAVVGLGLGFSMGTPLNYMILSQTKPEEAASAVATISLVRQMGTTLAPALLVGFISSNAGMWGYQEMLLVVAIFNLISLVLLIPYKSNVAANK